MEGVSGRASRPGQSDAPDPLVLAAMSGDAEAVRALWQEHRRWIAAVLLAYKPSFEDLEDLLQEVAVTFVAKIGTLRDHANLRAWLRAVAVNAARASARTRRFRPQPELGTDALPADADSPDEAAFAGERTIRVLERLERLPEGYREPLLLRAVRGMRSKQIAEALGLPPATVDTRIARARRMLRDAFAGGAVEIDRIGETNGALAAGDGPLGIATMGAASDDGRHWASEVTT